MTRLPRSIKIGAHTYKVSRLSKSKLQALDEDGRELEGQCDYRNLVIYIQRGMPLTKSQEVLIHEVLHACYYPTFSGVRDTEEKFVEHLAPEIVQLVQDNPKLVEYLTQKGKSEV